MITVGVYIYIDGKARRLDLFQDETISVTSSIQDINDIAKIFTDYSQSFTVPASDNNNNIFSHWYDNIVDNGFDARVRNDAYIELDTIPFKKGKIQLDKSNLQNGMPKDYTITFFGSLISLKDAFAGRYMRDIDFSVYNIAYNGEEVKNRVIGSLLNDVKFPLITSLNTWQYGGGGNTFDNYDVSANPINASELFPALRLNKVFDGIANDLGVTFEGAFLGNPKFTNAFLYLKNGDGFKSLSSPVKITFDAGEDFVNDYYNLYALDGILNYNPDEIDYNRSSVILTISTPTTLNIDYYVLVYKDDVQISRILVPNNATANNTFNVLIFLTYNASQQGAYTFYIESVGQPVTFTALLTVNLFRSSLQTAAKSTPSSTSQIISISNLMPEIKVEDFFSGVLKLFNLTCYSEQKGIFKIEQIETFYNIGNVIDITENVITDTSEINRVQGFKTLKFEHEKSESLTNTAYLANSARPYADLFFETSFDGGEYAIKVPFESILFSELGATNLVVGYALKTDLKPYIPKAMILYDYGEIQNCSAFKFKYDATIINVTTYNAFGNDTLISGNVFTLNFDTEQSPLTGNLEPNSLYQQYYSDYIANLYSFKSRNLKVKAIMPITVLATISLNDRLIIRDKRYLINSFITNLTTGEVDFDLLTDFRTL